jgi:hypothetical protein
MKKSELSLLSGGKKIMVGDRLPPRAARPKISMTKNAAISMSTGEASGTSGTDRRLGRQRRVSGK